MNFQFASGRADEAPKLHLISQSLDDYVTGNHAQDWSWNDGVEKSLATIIGGKQEHRTQRNWVATRAEYPKEVNIGAPLQVY